jgi:hypothetical protein
MGDFIQILAFHPFSKDFNLLRPILELFSYHFQVLPVSQKVLLYDGAKKFQNTAEFLNQ